MKEEKKYILEFMHMNSEKFGGFERFNVELSNQLKNANLCPVFVYNSLPQSSKYHKELINSGAIVEVLPPSGISNYLQNVKKILDKYKPIAIHNHFDNNHSLLTAIIAYFSGVRKIFKTFHSMQGEKKMKTAFGLKVLQIFTTKTFAVSNAIKEQLINDFNYSSKSTETLRLGITHNDIDYNIADIKSKYKIPLDKMIIGCIAFHDKIKGIDILLDAFSILIKNNKNIYLCLVGGKGSDIEYSKELKRKGEMPDIKDNIYWMGLQDDVPELINAFDIYCQPSRNEGISLAIMEALFNKIPTVATNIGGIPDLIINEETGLLFEKENPIDLANKLEELVVNNIKRKEISIKGYQHVSRICNLKKQVENLIREYKKEV